MNRAAWLAAGLGFAAICGATALFLWLPDAPADGPRSSGRPRTGPGAGRPRTPPEDRPPEATPRPDGRTGALRAPSPEQSKVIERFKDPAVPLEQRQKEIAELAERGDEAAVRLLMALGDEQTYLNRSAVEALGAVKARDAALRSAVVEYLRDKLACADALVLCAALRSLGRLQGDAAVDQLAAALRDNRVRADGHQDMVSTAAVLALGETGSQRAVPVLDAQLLRSEEKGWDLEYGSQVVAMLAGLGSAEGRQAAGAYADRLAARLPGDPLARAYYEQKIAEARAVAQGQADPRTKGL